MINNKGRKQIVGVENEGRCCVLRVQIMTGGILGDIINITDDAIPKYGIHNVMV
jgi:hypothetical protein